MDVYDITIIGAGPAGLFASFYAGMRQMKTKLIDALEQLGGQVAVLYPEKYIYDVPGFPKILGKELVKNMVEQALQYHPTVGLGERVMTLKRVDGGILQLGTDKGTQHFSKAVLITAGVGAFSPNKLDLPEVQKFEGKGIYYSVKDKTIFEGKKLLIVGGGDSAVDWALNFTNYAAKVTLIHRRDVFRAHEDSVAKLMKCGADVRLFYEMKQLVTNGDKLVGAVVYDNRSKAESRIDVDAILVNIGFRADLGPIKDWGLEIAGREVRATGKMETNIAGVYAAGDIATQMDGVKLNLIATSYAQAAVAVNVAKNFIDPTARVFPGHSSEMKR
ncbi:MAG: NAD(P)/FAD-dependent oxidoreductase [Thaumarchaeota archaeon]|nr:NAD(P)/FAD-dependent oxidoreductase [Nitrososphaerota archaeon]